MRVAVFHNEPGADDGADARDVLDQVALVLDGLAAGGHDPTPVPLRGSLAAAGHELERSRPDAVFNLVEAVGGVARRHPSAAGLLEELRLPYTGSSRRVLELTLDKTLAKAALERGGVPVPAGEAYRGAGCPAAFAGPWIVKPAAEDASVGIDEDSVYSEEHALAAALPALHARHGELLVERFVDGREFNVSVLAGGTGPLVLPVAEIRFVAYPPGKPKVLGYRAKWDADSFEARNTVRSFEHAAQDEALLARLRELAVRCWELFGIRGYARADFRVDGEGRPWCLEVNANPCLAPDGGFVAAARQAGMSAAEVVERILADRTTSCS